MNEHADRDDMLAGAPEVANALEACSLAIGRLDARISASFCESAWRLRTSWSGYTRALQLQGVEVDEIDIYAWGCGITLPGRPRLATIDDPFGRFAPWASSLSDRYDSLWRSDLQRFYDAHANGRGARLVRMLEALSAVARADGSTDAWLAAPRFLQQIGLTRTPLPCLVVGEKRLRSDRRLEPRMTARLLEALTEAAEQGLKRLQALEDDRLRAGQVLLGVSRPGALPRLLAMLQRRPVASPQAIAGELGLTLAGAGKLLARAAGLGLVREISGRLAWRVYMPPDLAVTFGFASPFRGRPRVILPAPPEERRMAVALAEFDREMAEFDRLHPGLANIPSNRAADCAERESPDL